MSFGVFAIFVKETDEFVAICESSEAAEVQVGLLGDEYCAREFKFMRPIDPTPWLNRREERRVASLSSQVTGFEWSPRSGFSRDSSLYVELGGIDPRPLSIPVPEGVTVRGYTRFTYGDKYASRNAVFAPRPGYVQDEEAYKLS